MLDSEEAAIMARTRKMSLDILHCSCNSPPVLEIVENISAWYDGSRPDFPLSGRQIPLGARMIAIVEAFDAITTDHIYRPARSQERAMAELLECAGRQFDPELIEQFAEFRQTDQAAIHWEVAHRWLRSLEPSLVDSFWEHNATAPPQLEPALDGLFQGRLLENMYDAVMFIDAAGCVVLWNRGAERLTGVPSASIRGQQWQAELLGLSDEKGRVITDAECPVQTAIRCGANRCGG